VQTPPALKKDTLRIIPLGGVGEIGRNCTVFEINDQILIVDCGVLFPEESQPGVDLILPDLGYLSDKLDRIAGLVLTHGHEDHIGGIPYLLKMRPDIPIYGSKLTIAFIQEKLAEHRLTAKVQLVSEGMKSSIGAFECEYVAVNHSIPDALAIIIRSKAGVVLATGDFKMDQLPLDGRLTDLRAFAKVGEEGVDLFMVDSTNADIPGFTPLERDIGPVIEGVISRTRGKVVVASFASHVHRVQQVIEAALNNNRKVVFVGRSMVKNMKIAAELGFLHIPDGAVVELNEAADMPDHSLVFMSTGSQGEPMAVLSRIANQDHQIEIGENDTVLLASSMIPGNENAVYRVIDGLTRLGANVVHKGNAHVHVSGHSAAGELLYCYNVIKPKNVMPIHGEYRHLMANAKLAKKTGVAEENIIVAEDGSVVDLVDGKAVIVGKIPCDMLYVDGQAVGKITEEDLQDRRTLAAEGFISIFAVVNKETGELVEGPAIRAKAYAEEDHVFDDILPAIQQALRQAASDGVRDSYQFQQVIRKTVGSWVAKAHRRRPVIIPIVVYSSRPA
jgi:ribonuclease J